MNKTILICFVLILISNTTIGQDHHFSNYSFAPLQLNPSLCGNFYGKTRVGLIYREQWSQFIQTPFQTANLYVDFSTVGFRDGDWISIGAQIIGDQAGDLNYQFNQISPSLAYHISLKSTSRSVLSIGAELGISQHISGNNDFRFEDELAGQVMTSPDRDFLTDFSQNNNAISFGVNYQTINNQNTKMIIGIGVQNILEPTFGTLNKVNRRYNIHYSHTFEMSKTSTFKYGAFTSFQGKAINLNLQMHYGFKFDKDSPYTIIPGLGYRIKDAIQLLMQIDYNLWSMYIGYDITVSTARAYNNGRGAFELGVNRIFLNYKKPKVTPILLCPRL